MRKLLIAILICLLLALAGYTIINGMTFGNLGVLGVKQIKEKTDNLDNEINRASKLASTEYPKTLTDLNNSYKELEKQKEEYENLVAMSTDENVQEASQYEKYELEFLYTKIGNHATSEGVKLKMEIRNSSSGTTGLYDLYLAGTGSYVGITDFISNIENDDKLGFKIDNLKLIPLEGEILELQGTFICKDISINIDNSKITSQIINRPLETDSANTGNTTGNTAGNTTGNSTGNTTGNQT